VLGQKAARARRTGTVRINAGRDRIALRFVKGGWDDGETIAKKSVK